MHPDKFGDSYDIVKQRILQWLQPCGTWAVHPMFAENFGQRYPSFAEEYSNFLGAGLLTTRPIPIRDRARWEAYLENRGNYFRAVMKWDRISHLFLDPDTGLWLPPEGDAGHPLKKAPQQYLMISELRDIAEARPDKLILVFDQTFLREKQRWSLTGEKLRWLKNHGVYGTAYFSHANFVLVSADEAVLDNAKRILLAASMLPRSKRLVEIYGPPYPIAH